MFVNFVILQAEPVYNEEKTEEEEDQEYIQELTQLIRSNRFSLEEVKKVQSKLKQRYGIEDVQENITVEGTGRENEESDPEEDPEINGTNVAAGIPDFDTSEAMNSCGEKAQPMKIPHLESSQNSSHLNVQQVSNQAMIPTTPTLSNQISPQVRVFCNNPREIPSGESKKTLIETNMSNCNLEIPLETNSPSLVREDLKTSANRASTSQHYTFHSLSCSNENSPLHLRYSDNPERITPEISPRLCRTSTPVERNVNPLNSPPQLVKKHTLMQVHRNTPYQARREDMFLEQNVHCSDRGSPRSITNSLPPRSSRTPTLSGIDTNLFNSPSRLARKSSRIHIDLHGSRTFQARGENMFQERNVHCQNRASPRMIMPDSPVSTHSCFEHEMRSTPSAGKGVGDFLIDNVHAHYQSENRLPLSPILPTRDHLVPRINPHTFNSAVNSPNWTSEPIDFARGKNMEFIHNNSISDLERSVTQPSLYLTRQSEFLRSCTPPRPRQNKYMSEALNCSRYSPIETSPDMFFRHSQKLNQQTFDSDA